MLTGHLQEWNRADAERRIREVLDEAKSGKLQKIRDNDGFFEIRFISHEDKEPAGQFLARGGPVDS
ncbi:hypothetical protein thsrh120_33130 [Rhizobium sp. No.120]|nr:hypothetical protein CKA34_21840 [Rhizobium sp. 11515TR]